GIAPAAMAVDVLQDDDGVVHDPADGYRQSAQGHDVDRDTGNEHERERGHDRDRNAHRGHEGGPQAEQEDEDRNHREEGAEAAFTDQAVPGLDDEGRGVRDDVYLEAALVLLAQLLELGRDPLDHVHGVRIGGLGNADD